MDLFRRQAVVLNQVAPRAFGDRDDGTRPFGSRPHERLKHRVDLCTVRGSFDGSEVVDRTNNWNAPHWKDMRGRRKYQIGGNACCRPPQSGNPPQTVESKPWRLCDFKSWNAPYIFEAARIMARRKQAYFCRVLCWNDSPEFRQQLQGIDLGAVVLEPVG